MQNVTLGLAVLLSVGILFAKLGQFLRLPSVTGYIIAGVLLGPSCLGFVSYEIIGQKLNHFTEIALMLIAFGIGEHLELKKLRVIINKIFIIGLGETIGAFSLVFCGTLLVSLYVGACVGGWAFKEIVVLSLLLGAVSVATAPAATLHVMREARAAGPLTTTLMAVVAIDNGLAIMIFGVAVAIARNIVGAGGAVVPIIFGSLAEILTSLMLGVLTGMLIDFFGQKLKNKNELLTAGLALLLLCGEGARLMDLSPLLAGMTAGFTVINRHRRDVRLFRVLQAFEAPIYVLFFSLAGAHLHFSSVMIVGWLALSYYFLRGIGKMGGAALGARLALAPPTVQRYLGLALMPQAGVAIGLIFLIKSEPGLTVFSSIITPVVLAGVFLSELTGPVCARLAFDKSGESHGAAEKCANHRNKLASAQSYNGSQDMTLDDFHMSKWTRGKLIPPRRLEGCVVFGLSLPTTAAGLARIATLFSHYFMSSPLAVHVVMPQKKDNDLFEETDSAPQLFKLASQEVASLGYRLETQIIHSDDIVSALLSVTDNPGTRAIIIGHPLKKSSQEFQGVIESVAKNATCLVIVVRFAETLHTEKILVPITSIEDMRTLGDPVSSLCCAGRHQVTVLRLLPPDAVKEHIENAEADLFEWAKKQGVARFVRIKVEATETRLQAIVQEAESHDLLIMSSAQTKRIQRFFFGSLAEDVAQNINKSMLIVHSSKQSN
ncbi:MAG: cation:proton antiporter [Proteobacteria bacterium]|nr:cation:proton antiporter [Pseudomonadota bacterium]MBU1708572.1 cation:proton antiporter [Pseudomonadota bacterium]